MNKNISQSVMGLSNNGNKEAIRGIISSQIIQAVKNGYLGTEMSGEPIKGLTLPGTEFGFEIMLWTLGKMNLIDFRFDGAEREADAFAKAVKRKPQYCTLTRVKDVAELMKSTVKTNSVGIGTQLLPFCADENYNFTWLDYCGTAHPKVVNSIVDFIQERNKYCTKYSTGFLCYVTFEVARSRPHIKLVPEYSDGKSQKDIIMSNISNTLNSKKIPHEFVMTWKYLGGQSYMKPMLTFGIAIGKCVSLPEFNVDDVVGQKDTMYRLRLNDISKEASEHAHHFVGKKQVQVCSRNKPHIVVDQTKAMASDDEKNLIEKTARRFLNSFVLPNGEIDSKNLNIAVFEHLKKQLVGLNLRNVSATITTRVVHCDKWKNRWFKSVVAN